jgi:histidyl-tRNA synthetase
LPKPTVLFVNLGETEALYSLKAINFLRAKNIKAELYPEAAKMKKQFNYADKREIPFVVIVGSEEVQQQTYTLKNMVSGEQKMLNLSELFDAVENK